MKRRRSIVIVLALLFSLTINSRLCAEDFDILDFLPAIISSKAVKKGSWVGDGLSFIITNSGKIENFEYNYEGSSECQNCKFTFKNLSINRRKFQLSNTTISFLFSGLFTDASHMSAQVTVASKDGPCSLSNITILAKKVDIGTIVKSFDSPDYSPRGLAFAGTFLWHATGATDKIYKLDTDGNIITSFDSPGTWPSGLAFDGTFLWCADLINRRIYKLDTDGNIITSFDSPGNRPNGLAFDGTFLWCADPINRMIYKLDTDGNIITSIDSQGNPQGLAYDGTFLWYADLGNKIYKLDLDGNIITSFDSPGTKPTGLAYDGTFLWNADYQDNKIYKIAIR